MISEEQTLIENLQALNKIADTLNRAADVQTALSSALAQLVELLGLETGWIFLVDPAAQSRWAGRGYRLLAHHNLPPAMHPDNPDAWDGGCQCQTLCNKGSFHEAYNEIICSRLSEVHGNKAGLIVHASVPLLSGERRLGIMNVAAPNWEAFTPRALALLTNVGSQMGVALERARLYDLLQEKRINEQLALLDLSNQLLSRHSLDDLMKYLVEEARTLLQVDACALLLPDKSGNNLYFRAESGWQTDPVSKGRHLPNNESTGPGLVMKTQRPLIIEDLEMDDRVPWMTDWLRAERFRGHAVVPLLVDGESIGTVVVNTRQPRALDDNELGFLRLLANQAAIALQTAYLHQEDLKLHRIEEELAIGKQIQLSMLPECCPIIPGWEIEAFYKAARQVGGDFYDFFYLPKASNRLGMVIADVSDKGIPAAIFMALSRTLIRTTALTGRTPAAALMRANELLLKDIQTDAFLTAFYAILHTKTGRLDWTNAGHNPPIWYEAATDTFHKLALPGIVLGIFENITLHESSTQLAPGDFVVFYTDGVTEAMSADGHEFEEERFIETLRRHAHDNAANIVRGVIDTVNEFTANTPQSDDFTLFIIKRK